MVLKTDLAALAKPGQFVDVALPGYFLRRPISVSWVEEDRLTLVYKIMGNGTDKMSTMETGHLPFAARSAGNRFSDHGSDKKF